MKDYKIRLYGDPILREKSKDIKEINDEIVELAEDMLRIMHQNAGAGLAAQQIGLTDRICVIDVSGIDSEESPERHIGAEDVEMPMIMVNPRIIATEGEQKVSEGCLSFPDVYVTLRRHSEVTVEFTDLQNRTKTVSARGFLARAVQHELDHLNGVLMVDHMSSVQKMAIASKLKRIKGMAKKYLGEKESA